MHLPRPPWAGQAPSPRRSEPAPPAPGEALAQLKALNNESYDPPAPKLLAEKLGPLVPVKIPPPRWREDAP